MKSNATHLLNDLMASNGQCGLKTNRFFGAVIVHFGKKYETNRGK